MKILFIACKYDYGKPELGYSYEYYNLYDSLLKMNNGGHEVTLFPFDQVALKEGLEGMNDRLLEAVNQQKPDLCFFVLTEDQIKKETIKKITDSGKTVTFNWFLDDKWRFENFSRHWAPLFHWVSTDQHSSLAYYQRIGYKNVVVGGLACNHFLYKPLGLPKKYDVTFVGQPHSDRKKLVESIRQAGIRIECFGRGWPNGKVSQEEMINIFCQSRINLNFSACSGKVNVIKGLSRVFAARQGGRVTFSPPAAWLDNFKTFLQRRQNEIKGRNFEVPGCGSFFLTGPAQDLERYYEIGKEIVCFSSTKDVIKKIRYYLEREQEREKIARAGYNRTLQDNTYEKRFNEIFKAMGLA